MKQFRIKSIRMADHSIWYVVQHKFLFWWIDSEGSDSEGSSLPVHVYHATKSGALGAIERIKKADQLDGEIEYL